MLDKFAQFILKDDAAIGDFHRRPTQLTCSNNLQNCYLFRNTKCNNTEINIRKKCMGGNCKMWLCQESGLLASIFKIVCK